MKPEGKKWFRALKEHICDSRATRPVPDRESLTAEQEMQCRIIGGSFIAWLNRALPDFLSERAIFAKLERWEKEPYIVFTSSTPGLVAAREILNGDEERIAFLYPDEFQAWLQTNPDAKYRWHIHCWSLFEPLADTNREKVQDYPLDQDETLWLHKEGTMCGPQFGRGVEHLWKWNGTKPSLLQEAIDHWVS